MKKHLQTKHIILFWFQVGYIKISDIFYKIQKFLRMSGAPIITTNGINFLMAGPLQLTSFSGFEAMNNMNEFKFLSFHHTFSSSFFSLHHQAFLIQIVFIFEFFLP